MNFFFLFDTYINGFFKNAYCALIIIVNTSYDTMKESITNIIYDNIITM